MCIYKYMFIFILLFQTKMKILGVEFAPLWIPFERRLQTGAVFYYCSNFLFFGFFMLMFNLYLLFTKLYFLPLLYLAWFIYDHKKCCQGGRRSDWYRRLPIWKYFADYFPVTMIKTAELDPNKNYILGYHPHGIMCYGAFSCFASEGTNFGESFPGIIPRILTLEGQFRFPFHREHAMLTGRCINLYTLFMHYLHSHYCQYWLNLSTFYL